MQNFSDFSGPQKALAPEDSTTAKYIEIQPYAVSTNRVEASRIFFEQMKTRRSIRRFSREPVEKEVILNAVRTAGTAPNGANRQPWFFAVIESQALKDKIRKEAEQVEHLFYTERAPKAWLNDLAPLGTTPSKSYLSEAPFLIAVFARRGLSENTTQERCYYSLESTGIAVGLLLTALHNVGLATLTHTPRPMNFLNELIGLKSDLRPFMLVVVGHPELPIKVPDIQRKQLSEICDVY